MNFGPLPQNITIEIGGGAGLHVKRQTANLTVLTGEHAEDENSLDEPDKVNCLKAATLSATDLP